MDNFNFKIDYNNCLTNLSCSLRKYFNLLYNNKTLLKIDKILEEKNPENIILILFDGLGSKILKKTLPENSFLIKNQITELTSTFPPTTTAATTSLETGLNPIEHGWLGWTMYINELNDIFTLFLNCQKGKKNPDENFIKIKEKYLNSKKIYDELNEKKICESYLLNPFCDENKNNYYKYKKLNDMIKIIKDLLLKKGKKFIYSYYPEPDHLMHLKGCDTNEVIKEIKKINNKMEELSKEILSINSNCLFIITADHGHLNTDNVILNKEISILMERSLSIEGRACSFKIKNGKFEEFKNKFLEFYGKDFYLFDKNEVIKNKFFGDGNFNYLFNDAIGDFIAISKNNKILIEEGDFPLKSAHAGISDDEVYVPLIIF
jgi:predicted AlkP superfamily pyrophosphatase or phosphodiesterase